MSEQDVSPRTDRDQAILLASRLFAAFLLFWVVEDIIELPRELFSVLHYSRESTQAGVSLFEVLRTSYLPGLYMMYLLTNIVHIALWLLAAGWFYRCGPRIRSFFAAGTE
jgi:hypothetical protein